MAAAPPPHVAATAEAAAAAAREAAERRRMYMKIWDATSAIQIRNNLDELQRLIETEGVPVDSVYDGSGDTLLMLAIASSLLLRLSVRNQIQSHSCSQFHP